MEDNNAIPEDEAVVDYLLQMFPATVDRDVIAAIVESCAGDLDHSTDALLTMISGNQCRQYTNSYLIPPTVPHCTQYQQSTASYAAASKKISAVKQNNEHSGPLQKNRKTSQNEEQLRNIIYNYNKGYKILILMRGLPGCGKSYLAKQIVDKTVGSGYLEYKEHVLSTDDYFKRHENYCYNRANIPQAHNWNQDRVRQAINSGLSPIVVDNTNVESWEMEVYVREAAREGYIIEIVEPQTTWARNPYELAKRNTHEVPLKKIKAMAEKYERHITASSLMTKFKIAYPVNKNPPQIRSQPVFKETFTHVGFIPRHMSSTVPEQPAATNVSEPQIPQTKQTTTAAACMPTTFNKQNFNGNMELCVDNCISDAQLHVDEMTSGRHNDDFGESYSKQYDPNNANPRSDELSSNTDVSSEKCDEKKDFLPLSRDSSIEELLIHFSDNEPWEVEAERKSIELYKTFEVIAPKPKRVHKKRERKVSEKILPNSVNELEDDWSSLNNNCNIEQPSTSNLPTVIPASKLVTEEKKTSINTDHIQSCNNQCLVSVPRDIDYNFKEETQIEIPKNLLLDKSSSTINQMSLQVRCTSEEIHWQNNNMLKEDILNFCDGCDVCEKDINFLINFIDNNNDIEIILDYGLEVFNETYKSPCICVSNFIRRLQTLLTMMNKVTNNTDTTVPSEQQRKKLTSAPGSKFSKEIVNGAYMHPVNKIEHSDSANFKTANGVEYGTNEVQHETNGEQNGINEVQPELSGMQYGTNEMQHETNGEQNGINEVQPELSGVQYGTNEVQHETNGEQNGINKVQPELNGVQHGTNEVQHETNGEQNGINEMQPELSEVQHGTNSVQYRANGVEYDTNEVQHETNGEYNRSNEVQDVTNKDNADFFVNNMKHRHDSDTSSSDFSKLDDIDLLGANNNESPRAESFDTTPETSEDETSEEIVNVHLGYEFIKKLDDIYGRSNFNYPTDIQPIVEMSKLFLDEINALWHESLIHQLSIMAIPPEVLQKQDEDLARVLSEMYENEIQGTDPNDLLDMDSTFNLEDEEEPADARNNMPDDMASRLTRDKLFNLFPDQDQDDILEVFAAYNNNFMVTTEVLLTSMGRNDIVQEKDGVKKFIHEAELRRQANNVAMNKEQVNLACHATRADKVNSFNRYRLKAETHRKVMEKNMLRARHLDKRGMPGMAGYYSTLASFHTNKFWENTEMAMSAVANQVESERNTVDLHYLCVPEALSLLDMLLDSHIAELRAAPKRHNTRQRAGVMVYVITGRGLHSARRTPRIKPAVIERFALQDLRTQVLNPGLIRAMVYADSLMSHELDTLVRKSKMSGGNLRRMVADFKKHL